MNLVRSFYILVSCLATTADARVSEHQSERALAPPVSAPSVCSKRQQIAYDAIQDDGALIQRYFDDKGLSLTLIKEWPEEDLHKLCEYDSSTNRNQGCWALYETGTGKEYLSSSDYFTAGTTAENAAAKVVYESLDEFCECFKGYEQGCIKEAPYLEPNMPFFVSQVVRGEFNTPHQYLDYCVFGGVTNGDFPGDTALSESALKCGCFWVDAVEEEIDNCAGVELGDFD